MEDFKQWWAESEIIAGEGSMDAAEEAWAARVPEGYVVVPREPTKKMLRSCPVDEVVCMDINAPNIFYKAMIAAVEEENE